MKKRMGVNIFVRLPVGVDKRLRSKAKKDKTSISKLARAYIEVGLDWTEKLE